VVIENRKDEGMKWRLGDDRGDVKQTTTGFQVPLIV
jgi:hypothetical protein